MRLTLSSAAAPDATLEELVEACARRGLSGLELVEGHAHGIGPGAPREAVDDALRRLRQAGIELTGFRSDAGEADAAEGRDRNVAGRTEATERLVRSLGVPWILSPDHRRGPGTGTAQVEGGNGDVAVLRSLPLHRPDALETLEQLGPCGLVWEIGEGGETVPPGAVTRVLGTWGERIRQLRLYGGGPESAAQEGMGIGVLMGRLTLARFRGALVLAPSTPRYAVAWSTWLGRRGGWGCGGSTELDRELVQLGPTTASARNGAPRSGSDTASITGAGR